ncbi:MAG: hypothetical protein EBU07_15685 [Betaproteobacteria bacterium]|nr:hypothetical protein [Betaproteobacteria bacterium]NBS48135.1 hypothetical protein [Betaproteobacteria bacterium]
MHVLDVVEAQLDILSKAVVSGAPEVLERHAPLLNRAILALAEVGLDSFDEQQKGRMLECIERLSAVRSNLARRSAAVERELSILMPGQRPPTYDALGRNSAAAVRAASRMRSA